MVMPTNNQAWPPTSQNNIQTAYQQADAWYTGDEEALTNQYAYGQNTRSLGLFGQVKRFFWGTPTPANSLQRPVKLHVPLPAEISRMSGAQLFAEMPTVHLGDMDGDSDDTGVTDTAQGKRLADTLTGLLDDTTHAELLKAAEYASAFGGVFLRVMWDVDVADKPFINAVSPDNAIPTFGLGGHLRSVIFWSQLPPVDGSRLSYMLLEEYTPGRIEYALYQSGDTHSLGVRVPLEAHPATSSLQVDDQSGISTGSGLNLAVYIPNMPARRLRRDPTALHLGRSDYEGAEGLFDALDEAYTSWMRDIRLAKARVFVSRQLLQQGKPGQGASFDMDREIFSPVESPPGSTLSENSLLTPFQPEIRWESHQQTCRELLERAYSACGYSSSTFGSSSDVAMTATEVQAREKLTMLTRGSKILYWRPQLRSLYAALMDVNSMVFHGPPRGQAIPDVEFPPAATDSPNTVAQTLSLLNSAEAASVRVRVQMLHPDWTDREIDSEVAQIKSDLSLLPMNSDANLYAAVADNGSTTGGVKTDQTGSYTTTATGGE